jgi:MFS family permease
MGEAGVGTLNAAIGLGGLLGAVLATALAGRRLVPAFVAALAMWGAPIALVGLLVAPGVAIVAMAAVGLANAILDVAAFTLLQRLTPNRDRVAVLGLVELVANGCIALGGILAPPLVAAVGVESALIVCGGVLPLVALLSFPSLRRLDERGVADQRQVALLRGDPLFTPLSLATIEHLAASLRPFEAADGTWIIRQGERGDAYYLAEVGTFEIVQDEHVVAERPAGLGVGEIALLRDVPRTASVRAVGEVHGFSLDRAAFLEAVTGHPQGRALADDRVRERLTADAERSGLH